MSIANFGWLRQEVANLSVASLVATIQDLLRLETPLKQGRMRAIAAVVREQVYSCFLAGFDLGMTLGGAGIQPFP